MKKIALMLMAACFAVVACEEEFVPHADFPPTQVTIPAVGTDEVPVAFDFSANAAWTATLVGENVVEWLSISPKKGEAGDATIKFTATANTDKENRTATLEITVAGLEPIQVPVVQLQKNAIDVNAEDAYTIPFKGGSVEIEVGHNVDYTYEVSGEWLAEVKSKAYTTDKLTFSAPEQEVNAPARTATVTVYSELGVVKIVTVTQEAWSPIVWTKSLAELGATPGRVGIGAFGNYVAFTANGAAYLADAATGENVQAVPLPEGFVAGGVHVDDAGNLMVSGPDVAYANGGQLQLYKIDPATFAPTVMVDYNVANFYSTEMGNFRVKGDVTNNAIITSYVCSGYDHNHAEGPQMSYYLAWEVKDGVVTQLPYGILPDGQGSWDASTGVVAPAGATFADGLFCITYGADYNLYYYDGAEWAMTWESPATWMENFNCISTTEVNGVKYLALTMSCHFNYDYTDIVVLDVTDPKAAKEVFKIQMNYHTTSEAGLTYSDIFIKGEDGKLAAYVIDPWMDAVEKYLFPLGE